MLSETPEELEQTLGEVLGRFSEGPESPITRVAAVTPTHHCWFYCSIGTAHGSGPVAAAITVLRPLKNQHFWLVRLQVWGSELLYRHLHNALHALEEESHQEYILTESHDSPSFALN